jgi:glycosyltransferase involved in cell wall biosynthesis
VNPLAFVIPAFDAATTVGRVVDAIKVATPPEFSAAPIIVIDDGSKDETSVVAAKAGAAVYRHAQNRGKGAALRTGFNRARELGAETAVTVDADAQHPAEQAWRLALHEAPTDALVLGVRDLRHANAPRLNQVSNGISNFFLSAFGKQRLRDTQCGLRRYPLHRTLHSGAEANGYAYEAELLLWAVRNHWPIVELPVEVYYPPESQRVTHFHNVRDPAKIVVAVVRTMMRPRE